MMYPGDNPRIAAVGVNTGTSAGTTITAGGTANTKGAWAQLSASIPFDVNGLSITAGSPDQFTGVQTLIDLGVGGAGSEVVLVPDIYMPDGRGIGIDLPVQIPKGTRLAARSQASTVSATVQMGVILKGRGEWSSPGALQCAGNADNTASRAKLLTDPGGSNTKGPWTELINALPFSAKLAQILVAPASGFMNADPKSLVDIGLGAAASEVVMIPNVWLYSRNSSSVARPGFISCPVNWPKGARVSARFQSANGNSSDRGTRCQVLLFG